MSGQGKTCCYGIALAERQHFRMRILLNINIFTFLEKWEREGEKNYGLGLAFLGSLTRKTSACVSRSNPDSSLYWNLPPFMYPIHFPDMLAH